MASGGGVKRSSSDMEGGPAAKKPALIIPTLDIGSVTGEEDLDIKVLKVQNRKLGERLREKNRYHADLERKVASLEQRQDDHSKMMITLRRMLTSLNDQLSVLCAPFGVSDEKPKVADMGNSPKELEEVFQYAIKGVCQLGEAVTKGVELKEDVDVMALVRNIQKRNKESGRHDDELAMLEGKVEELGMLLADAKFDLFKSQSHCEQLESQLTNTMEDLARRPLPSVDVVEKNQNDEGSPDVKSVTEGGTSEEVEKLQEDLAELRALADFRLSEINALSKQISTLTMEKEGIMEEKKRPPNKEAVLESAAYKGLQTQYTVAVQEISQLKTLFEDAKQLLVTAKQQHFMCLEEIRAEELKYQAVVSEEVTKLETALVSTQREYELLKIEYERLMASNEQAAPRARELQVMVDSLQKTLQQSKAEATRHKSRAHKTEQELVKTSQEAKSSDPPESHTSTQSTQDTSSEKPSVDPYQEMTAQIKKLKEEKMAVENELASLKAASSAEAREKAEVLASEKKYRNQVEELKKRFEDYRKDYEKRKEHIREEASRRAKSLTEDNRHLQKELNAKKHEAQALVSEMECTAQAFEEIQEQNIRLLEQIKEKDDANFRLMSERIKSNSVHKLLLQEKSLTQGQLASLNTEKQRLNELLLVLEDKQKNGELSTQAHEKELSVKNQALELHKRKAQESIQMSHESSLALQEQQKMAESFRASLQSKQDELEASAQTSRKLQEEIGALKRRLEKYKSREWAAAGDEVLLEEIRTYKVKLNCPCCSTRKKDTVLTKCFHVFCSECIRSRYDSRLRKCPKCGAAFGANDFHKIYLS